MGFLVSPGVEVNEIDLTNVIPAVSTSIGGYAGHFNWGPSGELINISSEKDLLSTFGTPDDTDSISKSFLVAASFLKYGNFLKVSRAAPSDARNAIVGNSSKAVQSAPIGNLDEFENLTTDANEYFIARCPGAYGNSLKVVVGYTGTSNADIVNNFDFLPNAGTGSEAATDAGVDAGITGDEIHIIVIDEDGKFTGIKGSILEKYQGLSLAKDAKATTGGSNYYKDVINNGSQFIFAQSLTDVFTNADVVVSSRQGVAAASPHANTDAPADNSSFTKMGRRRVASSNLVALTTSRAVEPRGAERASLADTCTCCTCSPPATTTRSALLRLVFMGSSDRPRYTQAPPPCAAPMCRT